MVVKGVCLDEQFSLFGRLDRIDRYQWQVLPLKVYICETLGRLG